MNWKCFWCAARNLHLHVVFAGIGQKSETHTHHAHSFAFTISVCLAITFLGTKSLVFAFDLQFSRVFAKFLNLFRMRIAKYVVSNTLGIHKFGQLFGKALSLLVLLFDARSILVFFFLFIFVCSGFHWVSFGIGIFHCVTEMLRAVFPLRFSMAVTFKRPFHRFSHFIWQTFEMCQRKILQDSMCQTHNRIDISIFFFPLSHWWFRNRFRYGCTYEMKNHQMLWPAHVRNHRL